MTQHSAAREGVTIAPTADVDARAGIGSGSRLKSGEDWTAVGVVVGEGAAIGARAVCVAPLTLGRWALVAAGAVVTKDVGDFALVVGVPARRVGWVGRAGRPLIAKVPGTWICPETGTEYTETDGGQTEN